jgi:exosortase
MSCFMLQVVGAPALREGNVVWVDNHELEVVEACSGMRIFVSIIALAFVYTVLAQRPWWTKALLWLSVLPIALITNSARIATTGLLYHHVSGEAAQKFSHDFAGWMMIPFAGLLMAGVLWYAGRLFLEVRTLSAGETLLPRGSTA